MPPNASVSNGAMPNGSYALWPNSTSLPWRKSRNRMSADMRSPHDARSKPNWLIRTTRVARAQPLYAWAARPMEVSPPARSGQPSR